MNQKIKRENKLKKIIFVLILVLLVVLAIMIFTKKGKTDNINNMQSMALGRYTNTIGGITYNIDNQVAESPNQPDLTAGMIPVKYKNGNWIITDETDAEWYDYENGIPAYIMLSDGTYQSELIADMTNKKLAEDNIGKTIEGKDVLGTIFVWIPKYAYNENNDILYLRATSCIAGEYTTPEIFTYKGSGVDGQDLALRGVWIEKESALGNIISTMNSEDNKYGIISNTKAEYIKLNDNFINSIKVTGINNTNKEKIVLKVVDENLTEPIEATLSSSKNSITIKIERTDNGIKEVITENGDILEANDDNTEFYYTMLEGVGSSFIVIDNIGNQKMLELSSFDVYVIKDKETLYAFRNAVNSNLTTSATKAYQVADIYLNEGKYTKDETTGECTFSDAEQWTPIASSTSLNFSGIYYGGGHTISGLYMNSNAYRVGFFGGVSGGVYDLGIIDSTFISTGTATSTTNNAGGLISYFSGGTVSNCYNAATVRASGYHCGGIIGFVATKGTITNCYNTGNISAIDGVGGIVGATNSESQTITNCYNSGTITGLGNASTTIGKGGIFGGSIAANNSHTVSYCYNTGYINGNSYDKVGGIIGNSGNVNYCFNTGNINGGTYVGGIKGYDTGVHYTYNMGNVVGVSYVGGIIGYANTSIGYGYAISYSYNLGSNVTGSDTYVGGIAGIAMTNATAIGYCYNSAKVTGTKNVGGIVGDLYKSSTTLYGKAEYTYNLGTVGSTSSTYTGGIAGQSYSSSSITTIKNSINRGAVYGSSATNSYVGAITGYTNSTYTGISGCGYLKGLGTATYAGGRAKKDTGATVYETSASVPSVISIVGTTYYKTDTTINANYPVLKWQTTNDKLNRINSNNAFKQAEDGSIILSWQN